MHSNLVEIKRIFYSLCAGWAFYPVSFQEQVLPLFFPSLFPHIQIPSMPETEGQKREAL